MRSQAKFRGSFTEVVTFYKSCIFPLNREWKARGREGAGVRKWDERRRERRERERLEGMREWRRGYVFKKNLKRRVGYGERKSMVLWMFWKGMRVWAWVRGRERESEKVREWERERIQEKQNPLKVSKANSENVLSQVVSNQSNLFQSLGW